MDWIFSVTVLVVSIVAGAYGTLVGGSSLLMIPTLILFGVPPHTAVASNRLGVMGITTSGLYKLNQKKLVDWKLGFLLSLPAMLGAYIGSNIMITLDPDTFKKITGVIILALLFMTFLKPNAGLKKKSFAFEKRHYLIGGIFAFIIGMVGSLAGGVGMLATYNYIFVFGLTFLESAGTRKIPGFLIGLTATGVFAAENLIDYKLAGLIFLGTFIGSYITAHFALNIGNTWVKRLFFLVVGIMALKMLS